jgi:hydroxypyruvate isomerase
MHFHTSRVTRRQALAAAGAVAMGSTLSAAGSAQGSDKAVKKGRLKQSVCRWCYDAVLGPRRIPLDEFCKNVAAMGLTAVDLLQPDEWEVAARYGLICSTGYPGQGGGTIPDGLNNRNLHDTIVKTFESALPRARQMHVPNLITFFGNRRGMPDNEASDNCIAVLGRIAPIAEANNVTVVVELLNSKVDHADYQGDHTPFGVRVVKAVNSPRIRLLYDIYHMQIMEGDIIRTIQQNKEWFAHYHTGGVPGRHELDATQELQWASIVKAILDTGYTGYFAHEFIPQRDAMASLREAVMLCDV